MALLVADKLKQDARGIAARFLRLLVPAPGRLEFTLRLTAICALTTLVVQIYGTPDPALTVYIAFFMIRPDRASSVITDLAYLVVITFVIGLIFIVAQIAVDDASLLVASIALVSFALLFLASASSKIQPIGPTAALIVGYGLDLLGSTPAGELATRGFLYAWLFVGIPAAASILCNILFGPSPLSLVRRALAEQMRSAAQVLIRPDADNTETSKRLLRRGNSELLQRLRLAALEHTSPADGLRALGRAAHSGLAILSAIDFSLHAPYAMLPQDLRVRLARTLNRIGIILERGGFPADVEMPDRKDMPAPAAAAYTEIVAALSALTDGSKGNPAEAPKEKSGFFLPDAFTDPIHVYYALKTTIAAMFCYILYSVLDWPGIHTCFITCYIVSLRTVAETMEKLTLRVAGGMLGAAIGLLTIIFVVPNYDSITALLVIVSVGSLAGGWIAAGSPRISYMGFQFAFAFFLCVIQGAAPSHQLVVARDRVVGLMLGDFVAFVVHTQLWPVSLRGRVEDGVGAVLRSLASLKLSTDAACRRLLVADGQGALGELESNIALIAYEPRSIRPPERWFDLHRRIAELLGQIAPALSVDPDQNDATSASIRLTSLAKRETPPVADREPQGPVSAFVDDRIRALEFVMQGDWLAQD